MKSTSRHGPGFLALLDSRIDGGSRTSIIPADITSLECLCIQYITRFHLDTAVDAAALGAAEVDVMRRAIGGAEVVGVTNSRRLICKTTYALRAPQPVMARRAAS